MTYAYGMKNAPVVGKGLGGLPRREALSASIFEVVDQEIIVVDQADDTIIEYLFSIPFDHPAELLVEFVSISISYGAGGNWRAEIIPYLGSGSLVWQPNSADTARNSTATVNTDLSKVTVDTGTYAFQGMIRVSRFDREFKQFSYLGPTTDDVETDLPGIISNPAKCCMQTATMGYYSSAISWVNSFIPASDLYAWHFNYFRNIDLKSQVKICSNSTYTTNGAVGTNLVQLLEFK